MKKKYLTDEYINTLKFSMTSYAWEKLRKQKPQIFHILKFKTLDA